MDKRELNRRINGLKEAYPDELALIEGIQDLMNRKVEVISAQERHALRQFPMQFTRKVNLPDGEWTTKLHQWADNMEETLLDIDPLILTRSNSRGESVLHALVFAATGRFTQMVNYELIQKMLNKNMSYIEMVIPNNVNSKMEGNAWMAKDSLQKTPMDYLVEFANGDGEVAPDEQLKQMLYNFGTTPAVEAPVDNTPNIEEITEIDPTGNAGPTDSAQAEGPGQPQANPGQPQENPSQPQGTPGQQQEPPGQQQEPPGQQGQDGEDDQNINATEDEIRAAESVARAGAQEKHEENPILETLLGMTP